MKGVVALAAACLAALAFGLADARAEGCRVPDAQPLWVDYAGHDAPIVPRPGMVLAVSSGTQVPSAMRAAGAGTVFFDLNFNNRVGTPTAPTDPATIADRAKRLYDFAVTVAGCANPVIALNELFGAQTPTPWSTTNAQYRANVLMLVQNLAALGAKPALTIANPPYTGDEAADWWREVAKSALLVRQVYFTSPNANGLYALGPVRANRAMRQGLRGLVRHLTEIGIPANRIALELQFQSVLGQGGREGLQPRSAWFRVVKWEALAARQVARETGIQGVWSWGWATFSAEGKDDDKPAAVCVYFWARNPGLCDGPKAAGRTFDASVTEGQLSLPRGARCTLADGRIERAATGRLTTVTGNANIAIGALFERAVLRAKVPDDPVSVLAAERAVIADRFGRSRARYLDALARARLTVLDARAIIADRLARHQIAARLRPQAPTARQVEDFLATYGDKLVRLVEADPAPPWLDDASRAFAVESLTPRALFGLPTNRRVRIDTLDGRFEVRALGPALPLAALPSDRARVAARFALERLAKVDAYRGWLATEERAQLATAVCLRDELPTPGAVDMGAYVPFLDD